MSSSNDYELSNLNKLFRKVNHFEVKDGKPGKTYNKMLPKNPTIQLGIISKKRLNDSDDLYEATTGQIGITTSESSRPKLDPTLKSESLSSEQPHLNDDVFAEIQKHFRPLKSNSSQDDDSQDLSLTEFADSTLNISGEIQIDPEKERSDIIHQLTELYKELVELQKSNTLFKKDLSKYFHKHKNVNKFSTNIVDPDPILNTAERYERLLKVVQDLHQNVCTTMQAYKENEDRFNAKKAAKNHKVSVMLNELREYQKEVGLRSKFKYTKRQLNAGDWVRIVTRLEEKERELHLLRLECIRKQQRVDYLNRNLMDMDVIDNNRSLLEFEQLQLENYNHHTKNEELVERFSKLQVHIHSILVLTAHNKEKVKHLEEDLSSMQMAKTALNKSIEEARSNLIHVKKRRHQLALYNAKLEQQCGMMKYPRLLKHYVDLRRQILVKKKSLNRTQQQEQGISMKVNNFNNAVTLLDVI